VSRGARKKKPPAVVEAFTGRAKADTAKADAAKAGTAKADAAKTGTAKADAAKTGTAKTGTAKTGTAKTGTAKTGTAKTGTAKAGTAKVRLAEVRSHLSGTYVTQAGGTADDSAFYVRGEVGCQGPGPLAGVYGANQGDGPTQKHVHSVIRTPNGDNYGKEFIGQHCLTSPHHR
jgi:hypothetical protein